MPLAFLTLSTELCPLVGIDGQFPKIDISIFFQLLVASSSSSAQTAEAWFGLPVEDTSSDSGDYICNLIGLQDVLVFVAHVTKRIASEISYKWEQCTKQPCPDCC